MIALFFVLLALVFLLQYVSRRGDLEGLEIETAFSSRLIEPGEPFELSLTMTNRRRIFYPFLRVQLYLPEGLSMEAEEGQARVDGLGNQYLNFTVWLMPRQSLTQNFRGTAEKRGRYLVQKMILHTGDFIGLYTQERTEPLYQELVVMPKEARDQNISQALGGVLGDISVRRFLYEDPVLTVGYRDYTGREPMKMISWTQAARTGKLMVKQYDYTAEASACVILNCPMEQEKSEVAEACFSLTRSVCRELEKMHIPYAFYTNAVTRGSFDAFRTVSEGLGGNHFMHIMEGLGRAALGVTDSCEELLCRAASGSDETRSFLFITPENDPEILSRADYWAEKAGGTLYAFTGEEEACTF